jgi:hypothetical protein
MNINQILQNIDDIYEDEMENYTYINTFDIDNGGYIKYFNIDGVRIGFGALVGQNEKYLYLKNMSTKKLYFITKTKYIFFYKDHVSIDNETFDRQSMRLLLDKYKYLLVK